MQKHPHKRLLMTLLAQSQGMYIRLLGVLETALSTAVLKEKHSMQLGLHVRREYKVTGGNKS